MKAALSTLLALIAFAAVYLVMSFCIPGLRIKLEAPPDVYFWASVRHAPLIKGLVSAAAALAAAILPAVFPHQ